MEGVFLGGEKNPYRMTLETKQHISMFYRVQNKLRWAKNDLHLNVFEGKAKTIIEWLSSKSEVAQGHKRPRMNTC